MPAFGEQLSQFEKRGVLRMNTSLPDHLKCTEHLAVERTFLAWVRISKRLNDSATASVCPTSRVRLGPGIPPTVENDCSRQRNSNHQQAW